MLRKNNREGKMEKAGVERSKARVRTWFKLGALIGLLLCLSAGLGLVLHLYLTTSTLLSPQPSTPPTPSTPPSSTPHRPPPHTPEMDGPWLVPIVPGVNVPLSDLPLLLAVVLLCTLLHEAGHAGAAWAEGVGITGFGLVWAGCYPGAYVEMDASDLARVPSPARVRIFLAGVFHNAVLTALALAVLLATPTLISPAMASIPHGEVGLYIHSISPSSPLASRLEIGHKVLRVDGCHLNGLDAWAACLEAVAAREVPVGHCGSRSQFLEPKSEEEAPEGSPCFRMGSNTRCMRASVALSGNICTPEGTCEGGPGEEQCVIPILDPEGGIPFVYTLTVEGSDPVFYTGHPLRTYAEIGVGETFPLWGGSAFLSGLQAWARGWMYMASLSGGLALLNAAPVYYLDGQHVYSAYHVPDLVLRLGTGGMILTVVLSFLPLLVA